MAEFLNTIDALGDAAVADSIIKRTITEFKDDNIIELRPFAFYNCSSLVEVVCPNLKTMGNDAFGYCTALKKVDCSVTKFGGDIFRRGCSALKMVILRDPETVATLSNKEAFHTLASTEGYIYVPRALLSEYQAATNWSAHASRFRALEDYTVDGTVSGDLDETKI